MEISDGLKTLLLILQKIIVSKLSMILFRLKPISVKLFQTCNSAFFSLRFSLYCIKSLMEQTELASPVE